MSLVGRIIGRFFAVLVGYVVASLAAGLTVVAAIIGVSMIGTDAGAPGAFSPFLYIGGVFAAFIAVLALAPAAVAVLVAEVFAIRRMIYYVLAGGLAGAVGYVGFTDFGLRPEARPGTGDELAIIVAAGLVGGLAYWVITGRTAGIFEERAA